MALYSAGPADPSRKVDQKRIDDALVSGNFAA
jgi:hypothetical protein